VLLFEVVLEHYYISMLHDKSKQVGLGRRTVCACFVDDWFEYYDRQINCASVLASQKSIPVWTVLSSTRSYVLSLAHGKNLTCFRLLLFTPCSTRWPLKSINRYWVVDIRHRCVSRVMLGSVVRHYQQQQRALAVASSEHGSVGWSFCSSIPIAVSMSYK